MAPGQPAARASCTDEETEVHTGRDGVTELRGDVRRGDFRRGDFCCPFPGHPHPTPSLPLPLSPFLSDIPTSLDPPSKPTQGEELQGQQEKATDPSPPSAQPLPQDPPQKSDGRRTCCRGCDRSRAWAQRNFHCSRGRGREGAGLHLYSWAEGGPRLGSLEGCFSMEDTGSEKCLPQPGRGWWEDTGLDL